MSILNKISSSTRCPRLNEERTIGRQVNELSKIGDVVVVNDGSVDSKQDVCGQLKCQLINLPKIVDMIVQSKRHRCLL